MIAYKFLWRLRRANGQRAKADRRRGRREMAAGFTVFRLQSDLKPGPRRRYVETVETLYGQVDEVKADGKKGFSKRALVKVA